MPFANLTGPTGTGRKEGELVSLPMSAVEIFKGSIVLLKNGQAVFTPEANLPYFGVAAESKKCLSAGTERINVFTKGIFEFDSAGLTASDLGAIAYLDNSANPGKVSKTAPSSIPLKVGRIVEIISATKCRVRIDGFAAVEKVAAT